MANQIVRIKTETIALAALLKWMGAVQSGAEAKRVVRSGDVAVNGVPVLAPSHRVKSGDTITVLEDTVVVEQVP